jgi:hypothetical protein
MSQEIWSEIKWQLGDIMTQYAVSEDKAIEIVETIGRHFEDRLIELGWDVMDSLIQSYNLLEGEDEDALEEGDA